MSLTLHRRFGERALAHPDRVAVRFDGVELTYGALDARSDAVARRLLRLGIAPGALVGICLPRSADFVVAILGVLKAGAGYLPLDPRYPAERLRFMASDGAISAVVTYGDLGIPDFGVPRVEVGAEREQLPESASPTRSGSPEDLAYVIYTSGSTGVPKGVEITHGNVLALLDAADEDFDFSEDDVWSMFHSPSFDFSVWELWGALLHGARLVVVPEEVVTDHERFARFLEAERVSVLNQVPSAFRYLAYACEKLRPELRVRLVVFGGEAFAAEPVRRFTRLYDAVVVNMYGITETTVHVTYRRIGPGDLAEDGPATAIGRPLRHLGVLLLDEEGSPVPDGEPGEMWITGLGLARGYRGRPELTAERFRDLEVRGRTLRAYRSGDLARRRPDGGLEFIGRGDEQLAVHGYRIEPGEIEAVLRRSASVADAAVAAVRTARGGVELAAYVVPRELDHAPTATELRTEMARALPRHMVPSRLVFCPKLPTTPSGKLDRKALAAIPGSAGAADPLRGPDRELSAPERRVAEIFAEVLELDVASIGADDGFFALGGDSMAAIEVTIAAAEQGLALTLAQVYLHKTVKDLAGELTAPVDAADGTGAPESAESADSRFRLIGPEDRALLGAHIEDAYPISRLQLGMLLHDALVADGSMYHEVVAFRVGLPLDRARFERCVDHLVRAHPALRTGFDVGSYSVPLQLVHAASTTDVAFTALDGADAAWRARIAAWVDEESTRHFDVQVPPLWRLRVFDLGDAGFVFGLGIHHALIDGYSISLLVTRIMEAYAALSEGRDLPRLPPMVSYSEHVRSEAVALESRAHADFWRSSLHGFTPVAMAPRPDGADAAMSARVGTQLARERRYDGQALAGLYETARAEGVSIKHLGLAAHMWVLTRLLGVSDVATGLVLGTRAERAGSDDEVGLHLNAVPLRLDLRPSIRTWRDLVRAVFDREADVLKHRWLPYDAIRRVAGAGELFDTSFTYVRFRKYQDIADQGIDFEQVAFAESTNFAFLAYLVADAGGEGFNLRVQCDSARVDAARLEEAAGLFAQALEALCADLDAPLPDVRTSPTSPTSSADPRDGAGLAAALDITPPGLRVAGRIRERSVLEGADLEALRAFCESRGVELVDVLLSAYGVVIDRWAEPAGEFVVHNLVDASSEGDDGSPGHLPATVPIPLPASAGSRRRVFDELVEQVALRRREHGGRALISAPEQRVRFLLDLGAQEHQGLPADEARLIVEDLGDRITLVFDYESSELPAIDLPRRVLAVLAQVRAASTAPVVDELRLMPAEESAHVLAGGRGEAMETAAGLVHEWSGKDFALRHGDTEWNSDEVWSRAWGIARVLRSLGVGPEARVGVCAGRSAELVTVLLGVLAAGGCYVPLDPEYPEERLEAMARDASVRVVVAEAGFAEQVGRWAPGVPVVALEKVCDERGAAFDSGVQPGNLAYVIYTSGSTGTPKGAMNQHSGVVNKLEWMARELAIGPGDVLLQKTPFSFDVSVWELFLPLHTGARLVVAEAGGHRDPSYLVDLIRSERVTIVHFVPSALRYFLDAVPPGGLPDLRLIECGGEELPAELRDRCRTLLPHTELWNMYGPTETAIDLTAWRCGDEDDGIVPIGHVMANAEVYVLDGLMRPVPDGVAGELYLGGRQVGRGYVGQPALTAGRFAPNPHGGPGTRLYRTGDRARRRPDGALEYLGRLDQQVKIRGYRIEIGEVEAALHGVAGIRAAAVCVERGPSGATLAGYFVPRSPDAVPSTPEIHADLARTLPSHMIPAVLTPVAALPTSASGKLDRRALPALRRLAGARDDAARTPETAVSGRAEELIADVWAEVLGHRNFSAEANFFEVGGDSLLLLRVHARLRQQSPAAGDLAVVDLFAHTSVRAVARRLTHTATAQPALVGARRGRLSAQSAARRAARTGDVPG